MAFIDLFKNKDTKDVAQRMLNEAISSALEDVEKRVAQAEAELDGKEDDKEDDAPADDKAKDAPAEDKKYSDLAEQIRAMREDMQKNITSARESGSNDATDPDKALATVMGLNP